MLEEFFRDVTLLQSFAHHYGTGEVLPEELIRKMKLAAAFGRADGMRTQLYYTTLSLDLHDQDPAGSIWIALRSRSTRACSRAMDRWQPDVCELWPLDGIFVELLHLRVYKVIALDFFAQFDPANLLGCAAASNIGRR